MSEISMKKANYNTTIIGCFVGYVVQAIVNNFAPLLFLTFQREYNMPLSQITLLVTFNFGIQLLVDAAAIGFVDKIGHRASMVMAHVASALGFVLLTILPNIMNPFAGILISVMVYAVGGGLLEVLVSPIMEACPTDNKEKAMSLLHSFYCWGHVGVVIISTIFFTVFGIENWRIMALIWAIVPIINGIVFTRVPMANLLEEGDTGLSIKELFREKVFWVLIIMMLAAGASEQAVSQWSSAFAEQSFNISKTLSDLVGPMMFAILMGSARAFYGKFGDRINLDRFMVGSSVLCVCAYIIIAIFPHPVLGMIGCGLCGLSVGIMWPGTFSTASASLRRGGTAMFALLALAGDVGCSSGPTVVGMVSSALGDNLSKGILCAIIFPILMILGIFMNKKLKNSEKSI